MLPSGPGVPRFDGGGGDAAEHDGVGELADPVVQGLLFCAQVVVHGAVLTSLWEVARWGGYLMSGCLVGVGLRAAPSKPSVNGR